MMLSGGVVWRDPAARDYWAGVIGDPRFVDDDPVEPKDDPVATSCLKCGAPRTGAAFCADCGTRQG